MSRERNRKAPKYLYPFIKTQHFSTFWMLLLTFFYFIFGHFFDVFCLPFWHFFQCFWPTPFFWQFYCLFTFFNVFVSFCIYPFLHFWFLDSFFTFVYPFDAFFHVFVAFPTFFFWTILCFFTLFWKFSYTDISLDKIASSIMWCLHYVSSFSTINVS